MTAKQAHGPTPHSLIAPATLSSFPLRTDPISWEDLHKLEPKGCTCSENLRDQTALQFSAVNSASYPDTVPLRYGPELRALLQRAMDPGAESEGGLCRVSP